VSKGLAFLKSALVALAMVGIVFPQARILAAEQKSPAKPNVKVLAAHSILDVSLGQGGAFTGRAIDHSGTPIVGAKVVVKQGKTEVGQSVTDAQGNFAVQNLKSGVYQVSSGSTEGSYRLWSQQGAPPSAKAHGLLVLGQDGARGQCGECGACDSILGGTLGAVVLVAVAGVAIAALVIALHAEHVAKDAFHSP
jgi:hypothetical protein